MRWLSKSGAPAVVRQARRLVVFVVGFTVLLIGIIMLVTPGPAFIVMPAGLAILATEFVWARRLLRRVRDKAKQTYDTASKSWRSQEDEAPAANEASVEQESSTDEEKK